MLGYDGAVWTGVYARQAGAWRLLLGAALALACAPAEERAETARAEIAFFFAGVELPGATAAP